ncbi:MAG: hypothetical protein ING71_19725 [Rhodocyclaceae bacterium]|nr:hypothetical protein [Rhodocyclaceae bacterium]
MDQRIRSLVQDLRKLGSNKAATWLIKEYPADGGRSGDAILMIGHLSWKKSDQIRLAEHYLQGLPFATARPYEVFASFMEISRLIEIMRQYILKSDRKDLFLYHVGPVLTEAAKSTRNQDIVQNFLEELKTS